jgi:hypothetical protein
MNGFAKTMASLVVSLPILFVGPSVRAADDCCLPLASADSPVRYFDGSSFAFTAPCFSYSCYPSYGPNGSFPTYSTSYYTPGYYSRSYAAKMIPPDFSPRLSNPWPYFYTPAGDYTPGYYSYYYTPGYFRY